MEEGVGHLGVQFAKLQVLEIICNLAPNEKANGHCKKILRRTACRPIRLEPDTGSFDLKMINGFDLYL